MMRYDSRRYRWIIHTQPYLSLSGCDCGGSSILRFSTGTFSTTTTSTSSASSTSTTTKKKSHNYDNHYDPTAKRPTSRCDPYGQGGKPLEFSHAETLVQASQLHADWNLVWYMATATTKNNNMQRKNTTIIQFQSSESTTVGKEDNQSSSMSDLNHSIPSPEDDSSQQQPSQLPPLQQPQPPILMLERTVRHPHYSAGADFLRHMARVADVQAHYPYGMHLHRTPMVLPTTTQWHVFSTLRLATYVLSGLSTFDFHLAMMMDVEMERPNVRKLWLLQPSDNNHR